MSFQQGYRTSCPRPKDMSSCKSAATAHSEPSLWRSRPSAGQADWTDRFGGADFVFEHADGRHKRVRKVSPAQTWRSAEQYERELRQALLDGSRKERKEAPRFRDSGFGDTIRNSACQLRHGRRRCRPAGTGELRMVSPDPLRGSTRPGASWHELRMVSPIQAALGTQRSRAGYRL